MNLNILSPWLVPNEELIPVDLIVTVIIRAGSLAERRTPVLITEFKHFKPMIRARLVICVSKLINHAYIYI